MSDSNQNKKQNSKPEKDKGLSGFVVRSAQGHGLPSSAIPRVQQAAANGMARVGMTSVLPRTIR